MTKRTTGARKRRREADEPPPPDTSAHPAQPLPGLDTTSESNPLPAKRARLTQTAITPVRTAKRQLDATSESGQLPAKRARLTQTDSQRRRVGETAKQADIDLVKPHPPPAFYDNLSKLWLTSDVLRELNRRNNIQGPLVTPDAPDLYSKDLARFARHGGPDLCDLRGYPEPENMSSRRASKSSRGSKPSKSSGLTGATTEATTVATGSARSSAYNNNFDQHLSNHNIHPEGYEHPDGYSTEPNNLDEVRQGLAAPRESLSPSQFGESDFQDFKKRNRKVVFETDVMRNVVPVICGDNAADIPNQQDAVFTELDPITTDGVTRPKPDFFDGVHQRDIHPSIRDPNDDGSLYSHIIPTKHANVPVAPNLFLEAKRPNANPLVAQLQARYDGAYGTRAMHSLQNYGNEEPVFDGNAYAFSSTYSDGQLKMYAHHPAAPTTPGGRPEYYMTQVDTYGMTGSRKAFVEGATAFRNARDMAEEHRNSFIAAANARARDPSEEDDPADTEVQQDEGSSPDELSGCVTYPSSQNVYEEPSFRSFQKSSVATDDYAASQNERSTPPQYLYEEDELQDESQGSIAYDATEEPPASFATSFTSSFSTHYVNSKRPRASDSPPSSAHRPKKHGSAKDRAGRSGSGSGNHRGEKNKPSGSRKAKATLPSYDAGPGDAWEWDDEMEAHKCWNKIRWEYWDEENQARKYWDGKKWNWVN